MFRGLEHPSAFPSMLRGSTPEPRPLARRDSYGSTHQLRRESNGTASPAPPTSLSTILNRRDSGASTHLSRRDSNGSVLSRKDSSDFKSANKRDSLNDDFRRLSFGTSIYLRPDSSGATNLIRRDSFGRRDLLATQRNPRDYVSKLFDYKANSTTNGNGLAPSDITVHANHSILRKPDDAQTNKENLNSDLTTANLTKHVTIWERDGNKSNNHDTTGGRRDSSGSLSNYLASRRISVDSLDVRQNSRRGSSASGDINLSKINDEPEEVNAFYLKHEKENTIPMKRRRRRTNNTV